MQLEWVRDEVFLKTSLHLVVVSVGRVHWFYQGISLRPLLNRKFRLCSMILANLREGRGKICLDF